MNKKILTIVVVVAVVILVAILALALNNNPGLNKNNTAATDQADNSAVTDLSNTQAAQVSPGAMPRDEVKDQALIAENLKNKTGSLTAVIAPSDNLSATPGSPEAPKQEVVTSTDKIPAKAIKIQISADGFKPKTFSVNAGQSVTLALTSTDNNAHVFIFPTASLMALTTMVLNGETKTITFNAPAAGTYSFRDDIPSYRSNTGEMIVK
ncbi:MAG: cupredoxin domain-containing protein [Patescibacteria group bacterium]|jgi:plastocyanin